MDVPPNLRWIDDLRGGRAWLEVLEDRIRHAAEQWELELGPVYPGAHVSYTCPARTVAGEGVVLKVQFPHPECRAEADALSAWNGRGAVRLLGHDPERWTLLLERCSPGTELGGAGLGPAEAAAVMADLTQASWVAPPAGHRLTTLADEAHGWLATMEADWEDAGRPFARERLDLAMAALRDVVDDQGPQVIINQDLHEQNVLASDRAPWLVIDPKPLVGERALSVAPIVRSLGYCYGAEAALVAMDALVERLGLDAGRVLRWAVGQSVSWGLDAPAAPAPGQAETVDRLVDRLRAGG